MGFEDIAHLWALTSPNRGQDADPRPRFEMKQRLWEVANYTEWLNQRQVDETRAGREFRDARDWIEWSESYRGERSGNKLLVHVCNGNRPEQCFYTQTREYHMTGDVDCIFPNLVGDLIWRADGRLGDGRWGYENVVAVKKFHGTVYLEDMQRAAQLQHAFDNHVFGTGTPAIQGASMHMPQEDFAMPQAATIPRASQNAPASQVTARPAKLQSSAASQVTAFRTQPQVLKAPKVSKISPVVQDLPEITPKLRRRSQETLSGSTGKTRCSSSSYVVVKPRGVTGHAHNEDAPAFGGSRFAKLFAEMEVAES